MDNIRKAAGGLLTNGDLTAGFREDEAAGESFRFRRLMFPVAQKDRPPPHGKPWHGTYRWFPGWLLNSV